MLLTDKIVRFASEQRTWSVYEPEMPAPHILILQTQKPPSLAKHANPWRSVGSPTATHNARYVPLLMCCSFLIVEEN